MSRVSALFDLQQTDSKIDATHSSIAGIQQALSDTSAVETAQTELHQKEAALVSARNHLSELEALADGQNQHADALEAKLYSGQIKGVKEMSTAQHEIATFRQRRSETDDLSVEAMVALETAEAAYQAAKKKLAETETEWQRAVNAFQQELVRLDNTLEPARVEREKRLKVVMPADLPLYERLRQQKAGVAVAEVQLGKTCSRCRVELPTGKRQEVKSGLSIVTCPSCGRILYYKM